MNGRYEGVAMIMEIGFAAGDIWNFLDKQPGHTARFSTLVSEICKPRDLLLMSAGWLAREGYVIFKPEGEEYRISLRKKSREDG